MGRGNMKLKNTTALVTGATKGIGLAIARTLSAKGVRLVLPWYEEGHIDSKKFRYEFGHESKRHLLIQTDLRSAEDIQKLVASVKKQTKSLDILINNIERGGMPIVHGAYDREVNREQWQLELDTTLLAKRLVFEGFLPLLKKARQASVINISSIAGLTGRSGPASLIFSDGYASANRAISSLTRTWARIGAPSVRVNELMLGIIDTRHGKGTRGWETLSSKQRKKILRHTLLQRTGTPEDVADTVLFLLNRADFMTGATVVLDGGYMLGGEDVQPMPEGTI